MLYQHGTLALLVPGLLEGTTTIGELLKHGDTGIGTGEGLDGELIILDGVAYKVGQSGVAERVPDDFTMPFANSHRAAFQYQCEREDIGLEELNKKIVEANGRANTFFSVVVRGTFSFIKTRAVIKQQAPYPTLVEVADRQAVFLRHDVKGTMLGYFSPVMFHGAAVAGFHEHFLSDDHTFGGHVLDAVLQRGKIYSQVFDTLVQHLPVVIPDTAIMISVRIRLLRPSPVPKATFVHTTNDCPANSPSPLPHSWRHWPSALSGTKRMFPTPRGRRH